MRMQKRKILQVIRPAEGGMKEHFLSLLKKLNRNYFSLAVAGPISPTLTKEWDIPTYYLPIAPQVNLWQDLQSVLQLQKILQQEKIDLIHLHGSKTALLGHLAARLAKTQHTVFTAHNFILDNYRSQKQKWFFSRLEEYLTTSSSKIITVSQALAKELKQRQKIAAPKVVTIYNGVELSRFQPGVPDLSWKKELGFLENDFIVGTIARLIPEKGVQYLLESALWIAAQRPQLKINFLVVGDGPFRSYLEAMSRKMGLQERVVFTGQSEKVQELLKIMDVFVLPSLSEGLGIVLLEALAMQKPVIGSSVGGIPEIIQEGVNGFLSPPGDPLALAAKILRLLGNPLQRKKMGEAGRKSVEKNFSSEKMITETERLYLELLNL